jgi:hypothetical protein
VIRKGDEVLDSLEARERPAGPRSKIQSWEHGGLRPFLKPIGGDIPFPALH